MSVERRKVGKEPWLTVEASAGSGLPDWFVPDEVNQTVDLFGGLHMHSQDDPSAPPGDVVSVSIDGRATKIISTNPDADVIHVELTAPAGQSDPILRVFRDEVQVFAITGAGGCQITPGGNEMVIASASDVTLAEGALYLEPTVFAVFGENGAGQQILARPAGDAGDLWDLLNAFGFVVAP